MSIQIVSSYLVGQQLFATMEAAQRAELVALFNCSDQGFNEAAAELVVEHAGEVIAILSGKPRTKKPRSDKGTKRGAKAQAGVP